MARILLAWELGSGGGHWTNLVPIARHFQSGGHKVWIALRDVSVAARDPGTPIPILQAPSNMALPSRPIEPQRTFAHILHNCGYADESSLHSLVAAWRNLFELTKPDLLVCEHSPTAVLASRGLPMKRVTLGAGFNSPPDTSPLPDMQGWLPPADAQNRADEDILLARMNQVLSRWQAPRLERVSKLFSQVDEHLFLTFPELDHFGPRPGVEYYGMWFAEGSGAPVWPPGNGPKAFMYMYPFPNIELLFSLLADLNVRALINVPGFGPDHWQRFESTTVRFLRQRLDIHRLAAECDIGILNGSNGAATALLLAGKPLFNIPRWVEQVVYAHRIELMGAGLSALPSRPERIGSRLVTLLNEPRFGVAARSFAEKYANFSPSQTLTKVIQRLESLLA